MMSLYRFFYIFYFLFLITFGYFFSKKIKSLVRARLEAKNTRPDKTQKTILIHAASGEAEYAFPVVRELKKRYPDCFIIFTFFTTSYEKKIRQQPEINLCLPLPFDFPGVTKTFLKAMAPDLVLISRTDMWPEFIYQCKQQKIPVILFSRTQKSSSILFKGFSKWLLKQLTLISAVSKLDAKNLKELLGTSPTPEILIQGDTRWDQVFEKIRPIEDQPFLNEKFFVAGSVWPEDLKPLFKAWGKNLGKLVIAPHEPTEKLIQTLKHEFTVKDLKVLCYSDWRANPNQGFEVLIIDQVGVLYTTYLGAYGALIGGSFKSKVHSVMESLAAQTPAIVGPYYKNNREATVYSQIQLPHTPLTTVQVVKNAEELKQAITNLSKWYDLTKPKGSSYLAYRLENPVCKDVRDSPTAKVLDTLAAHL